LKQIETQLQKISSVLKCRPRKSGDRAVTQNTMKANDADISEESQRELAVDGLKQATQDLQRSDEVYLDPYGGLPVYELLRRFYL
jgi:hypothetical protein